MRETTRRLLPLAALTALAILYAAVRSTLAASVAHLDIIEFPAALLVAGPLLWLAARPMRPTEARESPWRRHAQVVRAVADPETAPLEAELRAWVERGDAPERASAMLARVDPALGEAAARATTRRKREALVRLVSERTSPSNDGA